MSEAARCIVVWPSSPHLLNNGDAAMLQVTVRRLSTLFPQHRICVFVQDAALLARYCPGAEPLDPTIVRFRRCGSLTPDTILRSAPESAKRWVYANQTQLLARWPASFKVLANAKARVMRAPLAGLSTTIELLAHTDAVVATGGGFLNDSFPSVAERIMEDLLTCVRLSIPAAMFGQGLGPISNPAILRTALELFPTLALVGLREGRQGLALASKWMGGAASRIRITGDDVVEPCYRGRPAALGDAIGMNIRVSGYSGVSPALALEIGDALRAAATAIPAPLVPIVISRHPKDSDADSLRALLPVDPLLRSATAYDSPEKVAATVGRCRLVVTGSYHAGVFALAQGIPVIGLCGSAYYDGKFLGLREQFGGGVEIVRVDQPRVGSELLQCVRTIWDSAPAQRERLFAAARRQIALSEGAYHDFSTALGQTATEAERALPALTLQ
jgi:polysaccharide pyruvyl transferase WcaK-like protein